MKWAFKKESSQKELLIQLVKEEQDEEVSEVIEALEQLTLKRSGLFPIKTEDRIVFLKRDDIIAVEVEGGVLVVRTLGSTYVTRQALYQMKASLGLDMIQVSKQSLINVKHLKSLEASFSGNMLALLSANVKVIVSRRYLKELEKRLGL